MFTLHPQLAHDTFFVSDLALCRMLLMNNRFFPWAVLVPRRESLREITDLSVEERHLLIDEISAVSMAMQALFTPDKLNIAALGNQVEQLHVHVIARFTSDSAWPNPVWGKGSMAYEDTAPAIVDKLKRDLASSDYLLDRGGCETYTQGS